MFLLVLIWIQINIIIICLLIYLCFCCFVSLAKSVLSVMSREDAQWLTVNSWFCLTIKNTPLSVGFSVSPFLSRFLLFISTHSFRQFESIPGPVIQRKHGNPHRVTETPWKHSKIATHLLSCHCLAPKFFSHNYRNDTPMFLLSFVLSFTQTYLLGFEFYFSWPCYVKTNDVALEKVMLFTTRCEPKSFLTFWSIDLSFFTFLFFLNMSLQWCIHCLFRLSISGERLTNSWNGGYNMCVLQGLLYRYIYVYYPTAIRAWMTALSER